MLNHTGTVTLETGRLILRRFTTADAGHMFHNWTNDPEVCKYMRWQANKDISETENILANWAPSYGRSDFYLWAIVLKETGEPIGSMALNVLNENDECGDVAYALGKAYWNRGIVTEALTAVLQLAFETIGFNRIEAYHSVNNPGSGRVMQKCGMVKEGTSRQAYKSNAGFQDSNMYGILREDWLRQ